MQVAPRGSAMDADSYGNSGDVEATWAMQAMDHAECHMSLLLSGDHCFLIDVKAPVIGRILLHCSGILLRCSC